MGATVTSTAYGQRRAKPEVRTFICAGCGEARYKGRSTLVRVGKLLVHDNPSCRLMKFAMRQAIAEAPVAAPEADSGAVSAGAEGLPSREAARG